MEDLDFDELDQAVNNMMASPKTQKISKPAPVPQQVNAADDAAAPANPISSPKVETSESIPVSRPALHVPERRRTHPGAMDIIQPTTMMNKTTTPPSLRPGRIGMDIRPGRPVQMDAVKPMPAHQPVMRPAVMPQPAQVELPKPQTTDDDVSEELLASLQMHDNTARPAVVPSDQKISTPQSQSSTQAQAERWPDPLDIHDDAPKASNAPVEAELKPAEPDPLLLASEKALEATTESQQETAPTMSAEPAITPAQDSPSPFVTTKVEKRPLGAYTAAAAQPTPPIMQPVPEQPQQHEQMAAQPLTVPTDTTKPDLAAASLQSTQHLEQSQEAPHDLRSATIPQQYKTPEHTPKDDVHPLYDTKEYQAPPAQLQGARSGGSPWFVVLVVVLIVLLIAAAAVGYLMMTGTIDVNHLF